MKPLFVLGLISLVLSPLANAAQNTQQTHCPVALSAEYQVTDEQGAQDTFTLYRTEKDVLLHWPNRQQAQHWYLLPNGQMKRTDYFLAYQRGIEYAMTTHTTAEAKAKWQQKFALMPAITVKTHATSADCQNLVTQTIANGELVAYPHLNLLHSVKQPQRTMSLAKLSFGKQAFEAMQAQLTHYPLTDFADVGDNEADPFLAKMINQGFVAHGASGFYDANGTPLSGGHTHQHGHSH